MSALTGKTKTISGTPEEALPVRQGASQYIQGKGFDPLFAQGTDEQYLAPYREMYKQQNAVGLGQAKESAGNLTGSGYAGALGNFIGRSTTEQNANLSSLIENRRQNDAQRYLSLIQMLATTGVGPPTTAYQPGLLDYAGQAATGLATGGFFNGLLNKGGGGGAGGAPGGMAPPGGQLGQASRYNFDGTHNMYTNPSTTTDWLTGYGAQRDSFGYPRGY